MTIAKNILIIIALFAFVLYSQVSIAEYRVFNLIITKKSTLPEEPPEVRSTLSTLDPLQYKYYYPLRPGESVSYTETWMCKGRTDFQNFCPNPKVPPSEETSNP